MKQQFMFSDVIKDAFGGTKSHGKIARPLDSKYATHLVLKGVRGGMRTFKTMVPIDETFDRICNKYGVKVYKYSNNGNHLHAIIKIPSRRMWAAFIRELTGAIASIMGGKFWAQSPFTRIIRGWKKAFRAALNYVEFNQWEAAGNISRKHFKSYAEFMRTLSEDPPRTS